MDASLPGACYDLGTPLIPAGHHPALLVEHLLSLDIDPADALPGTGLSTRALDDPTCLLSPAQYLSLLANTARLSDSPETALQLGQTALPGHYGAASHALLQAGRLGGLLETLVAHPARLSPLLAPRLVIEGTQAVLYWVAACGAAGQRAFLVEMQMSALKTLADWRAGQALPWRYCFNRSAPARSEALRVHLGPRLRFGCQIDAMVIDTGWLALPLGGPARAGAERLQQGLERQAREEDDRRGLLALLYAFLLERVGEPPGVEETARAFGMSPATLKRRLQANGTHFQAELDQVRAHVALRLIQGRGEDNEAVARQLGIRDPTNFRRSFKRWTGTTPGGLRRSLRPAGPEPDAA